MLLVALPLAALGWTAAGHGASASVLPAGLPAVVLLALYFRSGRGGR